MESFYTRFRTYKIDIEGRAERSTEQYIRMTKSFCKDMEINDFNTFVEIKAKTIRDWLSKLAQEDGNCASSRNNKLTALKEMYKYLEEQEHFDVDRDISRISFAKVPKKERRYTDKYEMETLLYITTDPRVKSGIAIIKSTGIRFSELLQITCSDIDKGWALITGKGNKQRKIFFPTYCIKICERYIKGKRQKIVDRTGIETDLLFISNNGKLMSLQSFSQSLKMYASKAGIEWSKQVSPHKLRHGFITEKLDDGVPIQVIRDGVGHANLSTTNNYAHAKEQKIKEMMLGVKEYEDNSYYE